MKNYHSLLFVPATEKMLRKIGFMDADAIIIDLEDSVRPNEKEKALFEVIRFLEEYSFKKDIFIRVNLDRIVRETETLNVFSIKGYMLPKTTDIEMLRVFHNLIGDKNLIALVESVEAVVNIEAIASCEYTDMIAFGAEDYTTAANIKNDDEFLMYPKSRIVLYAKAYHKPVYDTISLNISNETEYKKCVQKSRDYGFDGKMAIHPMQVDVINQVYDDMDKEYYCYVLEEYEKSGQAVMQLGGRIFEKPHIEQIKRFLQED